MIRVLRYYIYIMGLMCVVGASGNLLDNPGFEGPISDSASNDQSNWYTWKPDSTHVSNWQKRSGSQALLVEGTWNGTPNHGGFEQKVLVTAGDEYGLNFYYYWDGGFTSAVHDVVIEWLDSSDHVLEVIRHEMDMGDPDVGWKFGGWHKFTDFALKAPSGAVRAEIRFEWSGIGGGGAFYVDDVDFSDSVSVCYADDFSVTEAKDYAFDFDYVWLAGFSATASQLELVWSGLEGELGKETYSINQVGNGDIWHSAGRYFLFAPSGATTLQARVVALNLSNVTTLRVSNAVLTEVVSEYRELKNNSFEMPFDGSFLANWVSAGSCQRIAGVALHGEMGLQFSDSVGSVRQVVGVVEGETYELVFQHRRDAGLVNRTNLVQVRWLSALEGGVLISNEESNVGCPAEGSGWQRVIVGGLIAPVGAVAAEIRLESSAIAGSAGYAVDDVFFRKPATFFRRSTTNILDLAGNPYMIRGLALSGWFFPEAYMFGINQGNGGHINSYTQIRNRFEEILGSEKASDEFWDAYTTNFLTEADVALVAARGVNTVRLPFNFRELSPENNEGAYRMKGFEQMDRVIEWCRNQGVYVILDMHSCPGGNAPVNSGDSEYVYYNSGWGKEAMKACLWRFDDNYNDMTGRTPESNVERTAAIWRFIAERYRNETQILGYELINEPFLDGSDDQVGPTYHINSTNFEGQVIRDAFMKVSDAVREVDDRHLFFVEGDMFAEWCDNLMPRWDDNMAVAFHRYWKTNAVDCLNDYIELRDAEQVPLWLSESGENSNPWCRELWKLLEEHNIGYTWWTWKRMGGTYGGLIGELPSSFEYCIDNLWNPAVDGSLFEAGLFDTAIALNTEQCEEQKGYFAALFEQWFSTETRPFRSHVIPGVINCVDYDVGDWSNAYYDTEYKSDSFWSPTAYNEGKVYRNDGVDIFASSEGCGYVVESTAVGEWLKYTVDLAFPGTYQFDIRFLASDMLRNGSFESGFNSWASWGHSGVTNLNAKDGGWSACLLNRSSSGDDSYAGFCQRQSVEAGKSYRLSFDYYMPQTFVATKRNFRIEWFDSNDQTIAAETKVFSVGQLGLASMWRSFDSGLVQAPVGAVSTELMFDYSGIGSDGGNLYIDCVAMDEVGAARQIRLMLDDAIPLTGIVTLPRASAWSNAVVPDVAISCSGIHTLKVEVVSGDIGLSSVEVAFNQTGFIDGDMDGMDDHWEFSHGGNLDATLDEDNDSLTTIQEYYADTDPTNRLSQLLTTVLMAGPDLSVALPLSSTQRVYSVEYKSDLTDPQWASLITNVMGNGTSMTLIETNSADGYFRIRAETP